MQSIDQKIKTLWKLLLVFPIVFALTISDSYAQPQYYNYQGSGGGNSIPFSWTSNGARVDFLYPVGDFGTVPTGKQISKLYFIASSAGNGSPNYDYFEVSLKQENLTTLTSGAWVTGTTNVISSTNYTLSTASQQWFELELETPFPFNPNLPLIVSIATHMSSFQLISIIVAPLTTGSWRQYATPHTATAPSGNNAYRQAFGFDLIDGASLPYCQDFEEGNGGFEAGGILSSWEYGEPSNTNISSAYSGDSAWVTNLDGDHNNDELSYVRSLVFDMTELNDPMLKFWCNYDLENGDDGVAVEVSGDSGSTWATLGSTSSAGPWYNSSTIDALLSLGNGNGWTGQSNGWTPMEHSLASYVNDTAVFIRWRMAADGTVANEGYGLDDIIIGESNDIELVQLFYPDSICGNSNTTIKAEICNRSYEPRHGFGIDIDTNGVTVNYSYPDTIDICSCETLDILTFNSSFGGLWELEVEINNSGDVNAANDTATGSILTFATPTATISGGGNYCPGEQGEIIVELTGTAPWDFTFTNGTTPTTIIGDTISPITILTSLSGEFSMIYVGDSTGCPADTSNLHGSATVNYLPIEPVNLGLDTSLCEGTLLDAGDGYSTYSWNFGQTTQTLSVFTTGNYAVTVTDTLGCIDSDTVKVILLEKPVITIGDTVLCEGTTFIFNAGSGYASYEWHDGSPSQVFPTTTTGTVSVTVTGFNGCESSKSATISQVVSNPEPIVTSTSGPAPVTLDAGSGYNSYMWSSGQVTQSIQVSQAGTYTCTVTNSSNCSGSDDVEADIWVTGLNELDASGFALFPNPANNQIRLTSTIQDLGKSALVTIVDGSGRLVESREVTLSSMQRIDIEDLPSGTYTLNLFVNGRQQSKGFVKAQSNEISD